MNENMASKRPNTVFTETLKGALGSTSGSGRRKGRAENIRKDLEERKARDNERQEKEGAEFKEKAINASKWVGRKANKGLRAMYKGGAWLVTGAGKIFVGIRELPKKTKKESKPEKKKQKNIVGLYKDGLKAKEETLRRKEAVKKATEDRESQKDKALTSSNNILVRALARSRERMREVNTLKNPGWNVIFVSFALMFGYVRQGAGAVLRLPEKLLRFLGNSMTTGAKKSWLTIFKGEEGAKKALEGEKGKGEKDGEEGKK